MIQYDTFFLGEGKLYASPKRLQKYDYALVKVAFNELDDNDDDRISLRWSVDRL